MKSLYLTVFVCLIVSGLYAQKIDLAWGPEKKFDKRSHEMGFVGRIKDHFYTLREDDKIIYLAKTRISDMSLVWEKPIQWNDVKRSNSRDKNLTFNSFRFFRENFVFYFEDFDPKDDIQRLYAQKINFEGAPEGDLVEVGSRIKQRRSRDGSFSLAFTPDSLNFVVITNPYYERYASEKFLFKVVDQRLNVLHNYELTLPFRDQDFTVESVVVSRSKTIYLLAKIDVPKKDRKDKEPNYYYEIVSLAAAENGKPKEYELKLPSKYIDNVDVIVDKTDNIKCFGFYADMQNNGKRKDGLNGIFYFSLAKEAIDNINIKEFDPKLVLDISGRRRANRDKGLEPNFHLKFFFDKPDGGAMVLAEEQFIQVVTVRTGNGGYTTSYHYYNNSILAVNIDPAGKIIWYTHIPKEQHTVNDNRFGSFHAMYINNKVYIVYNDEKGNAITKSYENEMRNYLKAVPVVVTINDAGKSDKQMIGADKPGKADFIVKPKYSDKIDDNEAFLYADRLGKSCCVVGARRTKTTRFGLLAIK